MNTREIIFSILPKNTFKIWKNKIVFFIVVTTLILLVLVWFLWIWKMRPFGQIYSPLLIGWFFGNYSNFSLPVFGTIVFIINLFLAQKSYLKERMASYFLLAIALFVQVLILVLIRFYIAYSF